MKKTFVALVVVLLAVLCLSGTAFAATHSLVKITDPSGAIMYDTYDEDVALPIAVIPEGSIAIRLATTDWGYLVTFGNYAGYIYEEDCKRVSAEYYEYEMPEGIDYSYETFENSDITDVPEFPYTAQPCYGLESIATRSGPRGAYTYHGSFSKDTDMEIYYQTLSGGVYWCYLEFEANNSLYRLYTSMRRVEVDDPVPDDPEEYVWVRITKEHKPRLGPGTEYANAAKSVPAAKVKGFFQENGWLMFEYTLSSGEVQRAWAPPGYWK